MQGLGQARTKNIMLLQHPCALRSNGVDLQPRLMVAEVRQHRIIPFEDWTRHISKMPLPDLKPTVTSGKRHQAAFFDEPYLVGPDDLGPDKRVACLSQTGSTCFCSGGVHHNSRAVVPTATYQDVSSPAFEEADLIEEWAEERLEAGLDIREATIEAVKWLREDDGGGVTRQELLENPQSRSTVRQQLRAALRQLR